MKIRYESEDGVVSGYGDEGKAAVMEYESDPLAKFRLPWRVGSLGQVLGSDGHMITTAQYQPAAMFFSAAAPLIQAVPDEASGTTLRKIKAALKEAING